MPLPSTATPNFKLLVDAYKEFPIEFPALKAVTLAHWAFESTWGKTRLAKKFGNYASIRWAPFLGVYGSPVLYADKYKYVHFTSLQNFIEAYWAQLEPYPNWREYTSSSQTFLMFAAPIFFASRDPDNTLTVEERKYARSIISFNMRATANLFPPSKT